MPLSQSRKRHAVQAQVEPGANYVFHLLALARGPARGRYASRYAASIGASDLAVLRQHAGLVTFGMGEAGPLADALVGLPLLFSLHSHDATHEYLELLDAALEDRDPEHLKSRYHEHFAAQRIWWGSFTAADLEALVPHREVIRRLGRIWLDNYRAYERDVWSLEAPVLSRVADRVRRHFARSDHIARWEDVTETGFKTDRFCAVLCSANEQGPNAVSICYDRVVFCHKTPETELTDLISHEIGTHILIDVLKDVRRLGRFAFSDVYAAYESLARYYNAIVMRDTEPAYDLEMFSASRYAEIYAEVCAGSPDIRPRELLLEGLEIMRRGSNQ